MITVKEDTTIVGVSEIRTKMDEILRLAKKNRVIIEKRNRPVAALVDIEKYEEMEMLLDALEDTALGYLAKERENASVDRDFIPIDEAEARSEE